MELVSTLIIPVMVLGIILYGLYKKIDIYDVFIDGAKESYDMVITMFPCMLAMILGVNLFTKSGFLEWIFGFFSNTLDFFHIPISIIPMAIMRPISGSASLAVLNTILEVDGPDSFVGRLASVIQGSTDTTLYILTLYFGSIGIKKIRYSLLAGLTADVIGIVSAIIIVNMIFR